MVVGNCPRHLYVWRSVCASIKFCFCLGRSYDGAHCAFSALEMVGGILGFMLASWVIWQCGSLFARIPLHAEPIYLRNFLSHFGPNDFMGIPLHGRWWIGIYYFLVLLVANVGGEEFWWRGYLLPRQNFLTVRQRG